MSQDPAAASENAAEAIQQFEESAAWISELATSVPQSAELLNKVAGEIQAEAAKLRRTVRCSFPAALMNAGNTYERQRRFPRWPISVEARLYGKEASAKALVIEMSEGGLRAATPLSCQVGDELVIGWRFTQEGDPFQFTGTVRYQTPEGIGIEFLNLAPADRLKLRYQCQERLNANGGDR